MEDVVHILTGRRQRAVIATMVVASHLDLKELQAAPEGSSTPDCEADFRENANFPPDNVTDGSDQA